jgi:hypothetical protein
MGKNNGIAPLSQDERFLMSVFFSLIVVSIVLDAYDKHNKKKANGNQ